MLTRTAILASTLLFAGVAFAEPTKVAFQVVCNDQRAKDLLSDAIRTRLEGAGLQITDQFPVRKLFVYAQRDVGDRINADGWSFAIVHSSNQATFFVASKLLSSTPPVTTDVRSVLIGMLREEGFLSYVNVAHVDKLDKDTLASVVEQFVAEFRKRIPSEQPAGR